MQISNVDNWNLDNASKKEVKKQLKRWVKHFDNLSEHASLNVYRNNFADDDIFFFTNCNDVLSKDPESKAIESSLIIRNRKNKAYLKLFVEYLLGKNYYKEYKCTHCGWTGENHTYGITEGHFSFCPKCGKTDICVFPVSYGSCIEDVVDIVKNIKKVD